MPEPMEAIIRGIEAQRDEFVRRCNEAIAVLRGDGNVAPVSSQHRFEPKVGSRAVATRNGVGSKHQTQPQPQRAGVVRTPTPEGPKSVKEVIREGVLSQSQPFTLQDVREFIKVRYPMMAGKIPSERYSKELYALRVAEKLFEIFSKGENGGAHVYKLKAA